MQVGGWGKWEDRGRKLQAVAIGNLVQICYKK